MITYLIIGIIVQAVILIERAIRLPEIFSLIDWSEPVFWASFLGGIAFNVLVWPIAIVCEILNVISGV